jgi:hypothetical protein
MTTWDCQRCGLPDAYRGEGDGIGSCDCSRCDCCGAAPYDCECSHDWDDLYDEDDESGVDYLCNDTACAWRRARIERAATK